MQYAVVFTSQTGNTRRLAEAIRDALGAERCRYFGPPCPDALAAETIFAGFWTDKGDCGEAMAGFLGSLTSQQLFLFGTAGFGGSEAYYDQILRRVQAHSAVAPALGTFLCQGQMPEAVRRRYASMEDGPRKVAMLQTYDQALGHPNDSDLDRLRQILAGLDLD